jgi:hypothetical protein
MNEGNPSKFYLTFEVKSNELERTRLKIDIESNKKKAYMNLIGNFKMFGLPNCPSKKMF